MTLLAATYALENMPVTDVQASKLIPADVADELSQAIAEDYDGFNMHAELERVLDLPFILEGRCFNHLGRSYSRRLETILAA